MSDTMLKLLVIGGYGNFGGRLVRRLATDHRLTIVVSGRSLHKAEACATACGGVAKVVPAVLDRDGDLAGEIERHAPDYVIDASGPWQNYGGDCYKVVRAALSAGANYLDLADSSEFVLDIVQFDKIARNKKLVVISGLSTCPALSTAVVDRLKRDFSSVDAITGGISPSPFAGMGLSVVKAIASYAGKPVRLYRDGSETTANTFIDTRRFTIAPPDTEPLPTQVFSLIDVPDLQLLRRNGCENADTWFGVSTRPASWHALLRMLVPIVKTGIIRSIAPLSRLMHFAMNHLSWGEHRGGMFVELKGIGHDGLPLRKSWHLVAEGDTGPAVPVLAAHAVIRRHLDGRPPQPGAHCAAGQLSLADFEPMFEELRIRTGIRTDPAPAGWPLFRRVIGDRWTDLPDPIRALHGESGETHFSGRASVIRGRSLLSRLIGRAIGFPDQSQDIPVTVTISAANGKENWLRDFDGHRFSSQHSEGNGRMHRLICERFGPVTVGMSLLWEADRLRYLTRRCTFMGIPLPAFLAPGGDVFEYVDDGRFHFHVAVRLPLAGHLVTYRGWLQPDAT